MRLQTETLVIRALGIAAAVCWLGIGYTSANDRRGYLDVLSPDTWVILCGMTAGAALATVRWRSLFALSTYVLLSSIVGVLRAFGYARDGVWSPVYVWSLLVIATVTVYILRHYYYPVAPEEQKAERS